MHNCSGPEATMRGSTGTRPVKLRWPHHRGAWCWATPDRELKRRGTWYHAPMNRLHLPERHTPSLPPGPPLAFGPSLFQLAFLVTGSAAAADELAGQAITGEGGDGAAMRRLVAKLPGLQQDWPAVMPHQPAALGLDAASARQVFALLGDLSAAGRPPPGVHLLFGVPRHELDRWLGTPTPARQVTRFVMEVGHAIGLIPPVADEPACQAISSKLADVDDVERGRAVRLHLLG